MDKIFNLQFSIFNKKYYLCNHKALITISPASDGTVLRRKRPNIRILMESIRININKQLTGEGLLPIISYPAEAAYDFRIHGCIQDMHELGANRPCATCRRHTSPWLPTTISPVPTNHSSMLWPTSARNSHSTPDRLCHGCCPHPTADSTPHLPTS